MIRFITTRQRDALRADAALVPGLRDQVAAAQEHLAALQTEAELVPGLREQVAAAEAARDEATTEQRRLYDAVIADLAKLKSAADHPQTGPSVRGELALRILRDLIAHAKQAGGTKVHGRLWLVEMLIGDDEQPKDAPAASTHDDARGGARGAARREFSDKWFETHCGFRFHARGTDGDLTEHICTLDSLHDDETDGMHCDETTDTQWYVAEQCPPANHGPCFHERSINARECANCGAPGGIAYVSRKTGNRYCTGDCEIASEGE